jgi:transcriptional regulator with XRE-family HTH domain
MALTLGAMVREARERRGLRAIELAACLGVGQSTLSRLENDKYAEVPPPELLAAVQRELDLSEEVMLRSLGYLQRSVDEGSPATLVTDADLRVRAGALVTTMAARLSGHRLRDLVKLLEATDEAFADAPRRTSRTPQSSSVEAGQQRLARAS